MSRIKSLLFLLALAAQAPLASATVTYAVGTCKPSLLSFTSINAALDATPAPDVVEVCPGTYPEQIGIFKPVTLEGVSASNSDQAIITATGGPEFVIDAGDDFGDFIAAQIVVSNVPGKVNISNLTFDATGNNILSGIDTYVVGVFYQNSAGTVSHLTVQNQNGNGQGIGIWVEGGSTNPSVTVENNNLQNFDNVGILLETNSGTSELKTTVRGNDVTSAAYTYGINLNIGETTTITENMITTGSEGVIIGGGAGSVSENKVVNTPTGIDIEADGVAVTSNLIYNTRTFGVGILANSSVARVIDNTVVQSPIGINFNCTAGTNVHSNTILDATFGLELVSPGTISSNTNYNVGTISSQVDLFGDMCP